MDDHITAQIAGYLTIAASTVWAWIGQNDSQITSICAILGLCLAAYGNFTKKK